MNAPLKPRADSVLKTLPAGHQDDIAEYARTHTTRETSQWLAASGVKISHSQISDFLQWHAVRQQAGDDFSAVEAIIDEAKQNNPQLGDRELAAYGQRLFTVLAISQKDVRGFVALRKLALAREIYEFSAATACREDLPALKAIAADPALTEAEKTRLFMEKLYGRLPDQA